MTEYVVLLMGDAAHGRFSTELERRGHRIAGGAVEVRRTVAAEERAS